jgi:predicted nicotinamide N-methyase
MTDRRAFILAGTLPASTPLVPELSLQLASELLPLWRKTERELEAEGVPPPYWAFAWAGGQALARYLLDHPAEVRGREVLDLGAGSGLVGIAAARAGAARVVCADIDLFAAEAIALNAAANGVTVEVVTDDQIGGERPWSTILVGDLCYERPVAERLLAWLHQQARGGARVLLGDPGRSYFPGATLTRLALYSVQTTQEIEDRETRETGVYRLGA